MIVHTQPGTTVSSRVRTCWSLHCGTENADGCLIASAVAAAAVMEKCFSAHPFQVATALVAVAALLRHKGIAFLL